MPDESFGSGLMAGAPAGDSGAPASTSAPSATPAVPSGVAQGDGSSTAFTPSTPLSQPSAAPAFDFAGQAGEYGERQWFKDLSTKENFFPELLKQHDHLQSMIGKRSGVEIPTDDSPEDVKQAFRKAMGVPENIDGYEYKMPDVSKEPPEIQKYVETLGKDTTLVDAMKSRALELGITPKQFQALAETFDGQRLQELKAAFEVNQTMSQKRIDAQHQTFKDIYGDKADYVQRIAKETAAKVLPDKVRASGDTDIALFEAMRFIHEKLYANDTVGQGNTSAPGMTRAQIHDQIMKERAHPAYNDPMAREHQAQRDKVTRMYNEMYSLPE